MITNIILILVGILIYLFIFWRRLKDDYITNQIFGVAFFSVFALLLSITASYWFPNLWFWISLLSVLIAGIIGAIKHRIKLFEYFDAQISGFIPLLMIGFILGSINNWDVVNYLIVLLLFGILVFNVYLNGSFKKFKWYRSGNAGFPAMVTLAIIMLTRIAVAVVNPWMLSFVNGDIYISVAMFTLSISAIIFLFRH